MNFCLDQLKNKGYTENFVIKQGLMWANGKPYSPNEIEIDSTTRIENDSDPTNQSIVYGLRCDDGTKGVVIASYGPMADQDKNSFVEAIEHRPKTMSV